MPKSKYDEVDTIPQRSQNAEINQVISAAHALELDAPIIQYRIVGARVELWTCHGGPFIYPPSKPAQRKPAPAKKPRKKPTTTSKKK